MDDVSQQLYLRFNRIVDLVKDDEVDQKVLKKLTDDFNYVYKRASVEQQGEYHYRVARQMKANGGPF